MLAGQRIVVIPGDGIGPEITDAAFRVLEAHDRCTPDLGGDGTTRSFATAIIEKLD